jgi:hypothetical protein
MFLLNIQTVRTYFDLILYLSISALYLPRYEQFLRKHLILISVSCVGTILNHISQNWILLPDCSVDVQYGTLLKSVCFKIKHWGAEAGHIPYRPCCVHVCCLNSGTIPETFRYAYLSQIVVFFEDGGSRFMGNVNNWSNCTTSHLRIL